MSSPDRARERGAQAAERRSASGGVATKTSAKKMGEKLDAASEGRAGGGEGQRRRAALACRQRERAGSHRAGQEAEKKSVRTL